VRAVISGYLDADPFGCCDERWRICRISDDFTTGAELGIPVARTAAAQERIAERSDAVVCVSQPLADRWEARGFRTALIPNGSDTHRLRATGELPRPPGIRLPDPLVGYVGQLSVRIDLDLLAAVADAGHSLLLVGGLRPDLDRSALEPLLTRSNVQWLGERPYEEIPALLGTIAVGLLPYAATDFNRASFPLKLLEYLGSGVAPVATDLPAVRWLGTDLVRVAGAPDSFVAAVDDALAHADDAGERAARVELAARHDWSRRAADYVDLLDQLDADAAHRGGSQSAAP
jgi:teichuronic acid biosynthesis glycosyltransferase TuaH